MLTQLRPRIERYYAAHQRHQTNLLRLAPATDLTKPERKALYHCYDVETAALAQMKHDVLAALPREIGVRCQYCGVDSTGAVEGESTGGWDHYLPRRGRRSMQKGFAEYSVHPRNLVPCCAICNTHKSDRWKGGDSQRTFINLYSDIIDQNTPRVEARVTIRGGEPVASFEFVNMDDPGFAWLFRRHSRALRLPQRYEKEWRTEMARLRVTIQRRARKRGHREDFFLQGFEDEAESDAVALGINHWKPTLYRGLTRSRDFVSYCLQGIQAPAASAGAEAV
ncbi:MAG: hypothetical protein QM820_63640 [Minicystis sp.]